MSVVTDRRLEQLYRWTALALYALAHLAFALVVYEAVQWGKAVTGQ